MSFSDHKITAFTHRIADLPDQPNLPADELKARFDSSPEELRESVNGICDDAAELKGRVDSIITQTFEGTIDKSMLSTELAAELDAKAVESSVASRITAEQSARENADTSLNTRVTTLETEMPQKCEVYLGTYTGNGAASQLISLGYQPAMVLVLESGARIYNFDGKGDYYGGMALPGHPAKVSDITAVKVESTGFRVYYGWNSSSYLCARTNSADTTYHYLVVK